MLMSDVYWSLQRTPSIGTTGIGPDPMTEYWYYRYPAGPCTDARTGSTGVISRSVISCLVLPPLIYFGIEGVHEWADHSDRDL